MTAIMLIQQKPGMLVDFKALSEIKKQEFKGFLSRIHSKLRDTKRITIRE